MRLGNCAHLLAPNEEYFSRYPEKCHFHRADYETLRAVEYIKGKSTIKTIVAGHTRMNYEEILEGGILQIVTNGTVNGYAREITVI